MTPSEPEFDWVVAAPREPEFVWVVGPRAAAVPPVVAPVVAAPPCEKEESDHVAEEPLLPTVEGAAKESVIAATTKACEISVRPALELLG